MTDPAPTHKRAVFYARQGFAVFPLYTIEDGRCSCGKECPSPGKHPIGSLVPQGCNNASSDPRDVEQWWAVYPDANIGIATGDVSGVLVLDVDLEGTDTLANLERLYGDLGPTWSVATGSGGMHLWFRMPNVDIRNSASAIGPGLDVRGNGGYVVAPPSIHLSGNRYRWAEGWHPTKVDLAEVPEWLLKKMAPVQSLRAANPLPNIIKEGMRNTWMASAAGAMRRKGFGEAAILAALRVENRVRCTPPLDDRELERIARSIERYAPAPTFTAGGQYVASA